jgi:hypothetical protein
MDGLEPVDSVLPPTPPSLKEPIPPASANFLMK